LLFWHSSMGIVFFGCLFSCWKAPLHVFLCFKKKKKTQEYMQRRLPASKQTATNYNPHRTMPKQQPETRYKYKERRHAQPPPSLISVSSSFMGFFLLHSFLFYSIYSSFLDCVFSLRNAKATTSETRKKKRKANKQNANEQRPYSWRTLRDWPTRQQAH